MKTFNNKANHVMKKNNSKRVMKKKQATEEFMTNVSFTISCLAFGMLAVMILFGFGIINVENWPF